MFTSIKPKLAIANAKLPRDKDGVAYWTSKTPAAQYTKATIAISLSLLRQAAMVKAEEDYWIPITKYWRVERDDAMGLYRVTPTDDWRLGYRIRGISGSWFSVAINMKPGVVLPTSNEVRMSGDVRVETRGVIFSLKHQ